MFTQVHSEGESSRSEFASTPKQKPPTDDDVIERTRAICWLVMHANSFSYVIHCMRFSESFERQLDARLTAF